MRRIIIVVPNELDAEMLADGVAVDPSVAKFPLTDENRASFLVGLIAGEFIHRGRDQLAQRFLDVNEGLFR